MKKIRKALVLAAGLSVMLLASCSTSSFMGLSKSKYVDNEINGINQSLESIAALEARMVEVERVASEVADFEKEIARVIRIRDELSASNAELKTRVDGLPNEIMVGLVNAIQAYLDSLAPSEDTESAAPAESETSGS